MQAAAAAQPGSEWQQANWGDGDSYLALAKYNQIFLGIFKLTFSWDPYWSLLFALCQHMHAKELLSALCYLLSACLPGWLSRPHGWS
jgi:hypothetical protein